MLSVSSRPFPARELLAGFGLLLCLSGCSGRSGDSKVVTDMPPPHLDGAPMPLPATATPSPGKSR